MKLLLKYLVCVILGCVFAAASLLHTRDEGQANSDLDNSWVVNRGNSPDLLFARPLENPVHLGFEPRMADWRRTDYGLPIQWLVIDHAPDFGHYYARLDEGYAIFSVISFTIVTIILASILLRSIRSDLAGIFRKLKRAILIFRIEGGSAR